MDQLARDDFDYGNRSQYWAEKPLKPPNRGRARRRDRQPLIICGHSAFLGIDRNTLLVRNGFTHFPQKREEFRYFPGDPNLPSRIVIVNASGSISFQVLAWTAEQKIPIIQLNWAGEPLIIANSDYCADPKIVARQYKNLENGRAVAIMAELLKEKFTNSISTIRVLPENARTKAAIAGLTKAKSDIQKLRAPTISQLLGIEGLAAAKYFEAWREIPINWKSLRGKLVPADWHTVGSRRSAISKSNRNARHPVNAMLNYAYGILHSQVKIGLISQGYDPTIGFSHSQSKYRDALVLDQMEPLRPIIDAVILKLALQETFSPADFSIAKDGYCRINPQLARTICSRTLQAC